jgi:cytochrome c-type biogenesis protein CcmE
MPKNLDDELERAISETASRDPDGASTAFARSAPGSIAGATGSNATSDTSAARPKGNKALLAGLVVMGAAIAGLFLFGFKEAAIYALPADQVVAQKASLSGRRLRVEGELVPGTLTKRDQPCEYRFIVGAKGAELPVRYAQCVVPDTFRDRPEGGVQVTVEGTLGKEGTLEASQVMAKCTSKYDPATHEMVMPDGTRVKTGAPNSPETGSPEALPTEPAAR